MTISAGMRVYSTTLIGGFKNTHPPAQLGVQMDKDPFELPIPTKLCQWSVDVGRSKDKRTKKVVVRMHEIPFSHLCLCPHSGIPIASTSFKYKY
jgi:hypothetical protein